MIRGAELRDGDLPVARALCRLRLLVAFVAVLASVRTLPVVEPAALATAGAGVLVGALALSERRLGARFGAVGVSAAMVAIDTAVLVGVLGIHGTRPADPVVLLLVLPLLEGGFRHGVLGAMVTWLAISGAVLARLAITWDGTPHDVTEAIELVVLLVLVGLPAASVSEHLAATVRRHRLAAERAGVARGASGPVEPAWAAPDAASVVPAPGRPVRRKLPPLREQTDLGISPSSATTAVPPPTPVPTPAVLAEEAIEAELANAIRTAGRDLVVTVRVGLDDGALLRELHGQEAADLLAAGVAKRLRTFGGVVGAVGHDELLLVRTVDTFTAAATMKEVVRHALGRAIDVGPAGSTVPCCGIGVAVHQPGSSVSSAELLHRATADMYADKRLQNERFPEPFDEGSPVGT